MKEFERKNPDGSLTIGCLDDTIKAPKKDAKPASKSDPKKGKKPVKEEDKAVIVEEAEVIIE